MLCNPETPAALAGLFDKEEKQLQQDPTPCIPAWARHGRGMGAAWARRWHGMGAALARHGRGAGAARARRWRGMGLSKSGVVLSKIYVHICYITYEYICIYRKKVVPLYYQNKTKKTKTMNPIEAHSEYLRNIRGYSENTIRAYEKALHEFANYISERGPEQRWSSITREDIDGYVFSLCTKGQKPATTNLKLSAISSMYKYMKRQGMAVEDPTRYESRRKLGVTIPNTIPVEDLREAYDHAQGAAKLMIGLLATTGIRIEELLNIHWEDINTLTGKIIVRGKGDKQRIVYTNQEICTILRRQVRHAYHFQKLFYIGQRDARALFFDAVRPFTTAKQVSPHAVRHTFATELAKAGRNVAQIAKALGHKSIKTTQRYIDLAMIDAPQFDMFNLKTKIA